MVTGIEAAGLALAILPLIVNQIDNYVRGIEKIKFLRRYQREFTGYSVGLRTQRAILLNTLEQALEGVVDDEDMISKLICDPLGEEWKALDLQNRLRLKLDRDYDVFIGNMTGLSELLEQLSHKLGIDPTDVRVITTDAWDTRKIRKIISKAVYDDLLARIDVANTALRTLIDQSVHRAETKKRRQPWTYLLKRYKKARKHAEGLFKTIIGESYWSCQCKEQHRVHLQLQTNPLEGTNEYTRGDINAKSQFRMIFSNKNVASPMCLWTRAEVVFEPWQVEEVVTMCTSLSLDGNSKSLYFKKPKVDFDIPPIEDAMPAETNPGALAIPPIQDLCSSLCIAETHIGRQEAIGSISDDLDSSVRYMMHTVRRLSKQVPQISLHEVLSRISRRDRLHIAAGLACSVIQFCGNWLKSWWDSSDVHLAADSDGSNVLVDYLYLSWPLSTTGTRKVDHEYDHVSHPDVGNNRLLPLGLALVELSLGRSLRTLLNPEDEGQDILITRFRTASRLVKMVYMESGTNYAEAVNSCLSWSGLCLEMKFEELVFNTIVSPLLKDLANFEGLSMI